MNTLNTDTKRFFLKTLGCKVNQYESQAMREALIAAGFSECLAPDIADIYIINTCTVTGNSDKESRAMIGNLHRSNPNARIVVTGCYAEQNAERISFLPGVSYIVKNADKPRIAAILSGATGSDQAPALQPFAISDFKNHSKAFVKIQDGCNNFCSYCKVPLVRSQLWSRPLAEITAEVSRLVANGFHEIVLTGICLGAWKDGASSRGLLEVLQALGSLSGDFRIRMSSLEPKYVTEELVAFIAANSRVCRHLHIPFQAGDDAVLARMNRPYTAKEYCAIVDRVRTYLPDAAITTDMLIGFPGESEASFQNTVSFLRTVQPARSHLFTYSRREGTKASTMDGEISPDVLMRRYQRLRVAALESSYMYRRRFLDTLVPVLVETKRDRQTRLLTGYSDTYIRVLFQGPDQLMRRVVPVRLTEMTMLYTYGEYPYQKILDNDAAVTTISSMSQTKGTCNGTER